MDVLFEDDALKELYEHQQTSDRKYKKLVRNKGFVYAYVQIINVMRAADKTSDLRTFSFLHYERLKHRHESSVRIQNGRVERLIFTEHNDGIEIRLIEIDSNHYGNKR